MVNGTCLSLLGLSIFQSGPWRLYAYGDRDYLVWYILFCELHVILDCYILVTKNVMHGSIHLL